MSVEVEDVIEDSESNSWILKDERTGTSKTYVLEPTHDDIKAFNRSLGYSSSKVVDRNEQCKRITVRPVDKSG
jgi:hypothetical protein